MLPITVHNLIVSLFSSILLKVPHGSAGDELKKEFHNNNSKCPILRCQAHMVFRDGHNLLYHLVSVNHGGTRRGAHRDMNDTHKWKLFTEYHYSDTTRNTM